jgi:hypothetical protein
MQPTTATTLSRPDLGAIAYEYAIQQSMMGFIGNVVLPMFDTPFQEGEIPVIRTETFLKLQDTKRNAGSGYPRSDWDFENLTYSCSEHGWEEALDDGQVRQYARLFSAEEVATLRAMDVILRAREKRIADAVFNATTFASYTNAVSLEWDDPDSDPKTDVQTAFELVRKRTGRKPTDLIISMKVFLNLMKNNHFKEASKYVVGAELLPFEAQRQIMSQYLGLNVLIGEGVYDTKNKGAAFTAGDIWDDEYAMVVVLSKNAVDLREPALGRTMLWTADSPQIVNVETYRDEPKRSNIIRVRNYLAEKIQFAGAGQLLSNITS